MGAAPALVMMGALPVRPDAGATPCATARPATECILTADPKVLCKPGYSATVRHTSAGVKAEVFRRYGITIAQRQAGPWEVDHVISLELGGADIADNLFPQPYFTTPLNAHVKDRLENKLHALACSGAITFSEAQSAIAADWVAAYVKYVGPLPE